MNNMFTFRIPRPGERFVYPFVVNEEGYLVQEDLVNSPNHYRQYPVEVIVLTEQMNFNRGNAVKYIARAGFKNPRSEVEDLRKAKWYIEREIARISKE